MNKGRYFIVLFFFRLSYGFAAASSSVIPLSGGGTVGPASSLNLSLTGLWPSVTYSVVCYIDTIYPFQYVALGSLLNPASTITSYSLNGNYVIQDQLLTGHNLVVINGSFASPSSDKLVFTNLDQTNPFNVNNCFGIPIQVIS